MAQLAYYAGVQPSESGQLTAVAARELLRRVHKYRAEDQKRETEIVKIVVQAVGNVAKQVNQLGGVIARAFR